MKEWIGPGMVLGDYEIVARIENEVFLVRAENGEQATLKLLTEQLVWEPAHLQRFIKAIKAAPPLDHRNICRTFDAGATQSGRPFVVSELVHGRRLDALEIGLLRSLAERLDLASQIADAVQAAHARGVLHLDLTPEKVLVEYDRQVKDANWINEYAYSLDESKVAINFAGRVKVLDFAVMMAALGASLTRDAFALQPSTKLEALPYCSPEWVSGNKLTPQSDIFSLGVLVYELLTGNRPFGGETLEEIRWAVFSQEPPPLTDFIPELSDTINRAVLKALAKDPAQRFHTAGEFAQALRGFVQEETASELQRAAAAAQQARAFKLRWQAFWPQAVASFGSHWRRGVAASIVLFELFFIAAILIHSRRNHPVEEARIDGPREALALTRITHHGKVREAVWAPDAAGLVYLIEEPERQSILFKPYGQKTKDKNPLPELLLATSKTARLSGLSYGLSGDFVYYLSAFQGQATELLRVPINGGPAQTLLTEIASPAGFAFDRKRFALARQQAAETQLVIISVNGQTQRILASWPSQTTLAAVAPAWSHDGKTVVCALRRTDNDRAYDLVALDVESGKQRTLAARQWVEVYGLGWLPGAQAVLVNGRAFGMHAGQIWRVAVESDALTALTTGLDDYRGLSLSADGSRLLTVYTEHEAALRLGLDEQAQSLPAVNVAAQAGLTWLNDRQLVYAARSATGVELREIKTDGQRSQLFCQLDPSLTLHGFPPIRARNTQNPSVIFAAAQGQQIKLWEGARGATALQPTAPEQLTLWPNPPAGGHALLNWSLGVGRTGLNISPPAQPTQAGVRAPKEAQGGLYSPNGEFIAANTYEEKTGKWQLSIWPVNGGNAVHTFALPGGMPQRLRWLPDGSAIIYATTERGTDNLWQQPIHGGPAVPLTKFTKQRLYDFAWSPDGRQCAVLRGEPHSEVYLLETSKLKNQAQ